MIIAIVDSAKNLEMRHGGREYGSDKSVRMISFEGGTRRLEGLRFDIIFINRLKLRDLIDGERWRQVATVMACNVCLFDDIKELL